MSLDEIQIDDEFAIADANLTIEEAAKIIREKNVPDLVIVKDSVFKGVVTDFDIITKILAEGKDPKIENIGSIVHKIPPLKKESATVEEAFRVMEKHQKPIVPVIDREGKILGVVSMMDVWGILTEEEVEKIRAELDTVVDTEESEGE